LPESTRQSPVAVIVTPIGTERGNLMITAARRTGVVALCLAIAGALAAVVPQSASAEDSGVPTRTVVTSTNFHPVYGQRYTIRGQVQLASVAEVGGAATYTPFPKQTVALQL
jgi:hypothetical protein